MASAIHISAVNGGNINAIGSYGILAGATNHYYASGAAVITASQAHLPVVVTSSGSVAFSVAFATVEGAAFLRSVASDYSGVTATGARFAISANGVIDSDGENDATYFPGNALGAVASGGVWV